MKLDLRQTQSSVDRLATSEEIRAAVALSSESPEEEYETSAVWEIAADFGGYVRIPSTEIETLRLIEELYADTDSRTN